MLKAEKDGNSGAAKWKKKKSCLDLPPFFLREIDNCEVFMKFFIFLNIGIGFETELRTVNIKNIYFI